MEQITYTNERGEWKLYETKLLLRGGNEEVIYGFFLDSRPPQKARGWNPTKKVKAGYEFYENERISKPFIRKCK